MKELITTQLIEEYQKEVDRLERVIDAMKEIDPMLVTESRLRKEFITSLQSKQSEERQNIVDAARHDDLKLSGEDYFNQTFKQEQK